MRAVKEANDGISHTNVMRPWFGLLRSGTEDLAASRHPVRHAVATHVL